ncbi:MAG: hypothetical protein FWC46_02245, partial [Actinomycetia bacterium]|nr:hypothetical protein [Actinomycetes bacterium]
MKPNHRRLLGLATGLAALSLALTACGAPGGTTTTTTTTNPATNTSTGASTTTTSGSGVPDKPSSPVTLNILDIAGNLQLTQGMIDSYVAAHQDIIKSVTYSTGTAPDMPGKVKAQQQA